MKLHINPKRVLFTRDIKIYGHFLEHFHRQVYGGVYDPGNPLSDEDGFRQDVLAAMRKIKVPILRWPGGCFVSAYNWKNGVGGVRTPVYDKAWRVEEPNTFGTDEYIRLCGKIGCEPYICTNAGTGTPEEMSDWVEYCNLGNIGKYARRRIANGSLQPFNVKYWSIGNENYGAWEIGAKTAGEWSRYVQESAKMMLRADPAIELSAAALADTDWNVRLLKASGGYLDWISVHRYWDAIHQTNDCAGYKECMAYTAELEDDIRQVRGLLAAMQLENKIRIAFDEWNLRGWYHPDSHTLKPGQGKTDYLKERDRNDDNALYTMADTIFTACFLNTLNRNADIVGMANFAPVINTRGCIYTHPGGIVLRGTYHIFDLYVNYLGDKVLDIWAEGETTMPAVSKSGESMQVPALDAVAASCTDGGIISVAAVNKLPDEPQMLEIVFDADGGQLPEEYRVCGVYAGGTESYNDIDVNGITLSEGKWQKTECAGLVINLPAHSANIIQFK